MIETIVMWVTTSVNSSTTRRRAASHEPASPAGLPRSSRVGHRKDFQKRRKQAGCTAGEGRRRFRKAHGRRVRVTGGRAILAPPQGKRRHEQPPQWR